MICTLDSGHYIHVIVDIDKLQLFAMIMISHTAIVCYTSEPSPVLSAKLASGLAKLSSQASGSSGA